MKGWSKLVFASAALAAIVVAGSFRALSNGRYVFGGTIDGASLSVQIEPLNSNSCAFKVSAANVNFTNLTNPITVVLTIGDDSGAAPAKSK